MAETSAFITPFIVNISDGDIEDLRRRLRESRWPDQPSGIGWSQGTDLGYLRGLIEYWRSSFDWPAFEARLNSYPQYMTLVDGVNIHFYHVPSAVPGARPLLLLHGWPSSPFEFAGLIDRLSNPVAHGGLSEDAYHLVIPSLPGFGFSGPTTIAGLTPIGIAHRFAELMTRLGYARFFSHGGDFGAVVSGHLARSYPDRVIGVHLTFFPTAGLRPEDGEPTALERRLRDQQMAYARWETGYISIQSTKPQTLAYGLIDSPVALAAWLVEKFRAWTENDGNVETGLSRDEILTIVSTYWVTRTAGSAARLYYETGAAGQFGPSPHRIEVPTAIAMPPFEPYRTTRRMAEHHANVVHWVDLPKGGHFSALEQPESVASAIAEALRDLR